MKTVVFIIGTNAVGKSTLARLLIGRCGGVQRIDSDITYCGDGVHAFAGSYAGSTYGGVDAVKNEKGSSCTSRLAGIVEAALKTRDTVYCEGMMLHTFGINLTNAAFKGDRALVVFLYASPQVIDGRLLERSNKRVTQSILKKQIATAASARRWAQIGVPVLTFDTGSVPIERVADRVQEKVTELCGR